MVVPARVKNLRKNFRDCLPGCVFSKILWSVVVVVLVGWAVGDFNEVYAVTCGDAGTLNECGADGGCVEEYVCRRIQMPGSTIFECLYNGCSSSADPPPEDPVPEPEETCSPELACGAAAGCEENQICMRPSALAELECQNITPETEDSCLSPECEGPEDCEGDTPVCNEAGFCVAGESGDECGPSGACGADGGCAPGWRCMPLGPGLYQCQEDPEYCDPTPSPPADPGADPPVYQGPIISDFATITRSIYRLLYPIGIAIGVLFIAKAGYVLMTSEGDPMRTKQGRDELTGAIAGTLFIILAISLLRIIVGSFLGIPNAF